MSSLPGGAKIVYVDPSQLNGYQIVYQAPAGAKAATANAALASAVPASTSAPVRTIVQQAAPVRTVAQTVVQQQAGQGGAQNVVKRIIQVPALQQSQGQNVVRRVIQIPAGQQGTQIAGQNVVRRVIQVPGQTTTQNVVQISQAQTTGQNVVQRVQTAGQNVMHLTQAQAGGQNVVQRVLSTGQNVIQISQAQTAGQNVVHLSQAQTAGQNVVHLSQAQTTAQNVIQRVQTTGQNVMHFSQAQTTGQNVIQRVQTAGQNVMHISQAQTTGQNVMQRVQTTGQNVVHISSAGNMTQALQQQGARVIQVASQPTSTPVITQQQRINPPVVVQQPVVQEEPQQQEEEEPQVDIDINNVVCSFNVRCHLNLKKIAMEGANVVYKRENGMVNMKLRHPHTTASIWSSGKITCTGATSEDAAKIAARRISRILQKMGYRVRMCNFRVVNVLGTCALPWGIRITHFSNEHRQNASYEPELHPGVTYRIKEPKATLKIFSTGSITVTAPCVQNVGTAIEHIYPLVHPFRMEKAKVDKDEQQKTKHYLQDGDSGKRRARPPPRPYKRVRLDEPSDEEEDTEDEDSEFYDDEEFDSEEDQN